MTWTRLSDDFADRADVMSLSAEAFRLHVVGLVWANRLLLDGLVPKRSTAVLAALAGVADAVPLISELLHAGMWVEHDDAYQLDWTDQQTKAAIDQQRARTAERTQRWRLHKAGDHSLCDYCSAKRDGVTNTVTDNARTPSVTGVPSPSPSPSPSPTHREGEGEGEMAAEAADPSARAAGSSTTTAIEAMRRLRKVAQR